MDIQIDVPIVKFIIQVDAFEDVKDILRKQKNVSICMLGKQMD